MPTTKGAFKIFTFAGIGVYVHWSWLIVAYWRISSSTHTYSSHVFNVLEYLSLFLIVLIHEFGHQLACRSVGGQTHDIVLWPLGGVAYVNPPQRPGAELWSIAAGPLVNVILFPIFSVACILTRHLGLAETHWDIYQLIVNVWLINLILLIFNLLPIYPLDGGQILRALLWFVFGRVKSLLIATIFGLVSLVAVIVWLVMSKTLGSDPNSLLWTAAIGFFILMNGWRGLRGALSLMRLAKLPRRAGYACPSCNSAPPAMPLWHCGKCGQPFDFFLTAGTCPNCQTTYDSIQCIDCGLRTPLAAWKTPPPIDV